MSAPLYQLKAEFFKTLGHPARIRVLELLSDREHAVAEMLPEVGIEPAHLSQQLAVLRRAGLVTPRKEGSAVYYSLTSPDIAELLAVARLILTGVLSGQAELLQDLRASAAGLTGRSSAGRGSPQARLHQRAGRGCRRCRERDGAYAGVSAEVVGGRLTSRRGPPDRTGSAARSGRHRPGEVAVPGVSSQSWQEVVPGVK